MLKIDANYTDYRDDTDPDYPMGKAIPASTPDSNDGTPWLDKMFNDLHGARTAIFKKAFGNTRQPSNVPDNAEESDTLDAILKLIQNAFSLRIFDIEISGTETVVSWETLGISYSANKRYAAIVTPSGDYAEFLPFGTECKNDGLHIYPRKLINGEIIPGTRHIKWGTRKWGIGKWNDFDTMHVNLQFQEIL